MGGFCLKKLRCQLLCVFFLCLAMLVSVCTASAAGYSADIVTTDKNGTNQSKIWVSYSLWAQRMEIPSQPSMVMIVRMDRKVVWNIDMKEKMYMEFPMRPGMATTAIASGEKSPAEVERTYLLTETVEGHLADKYQITYQSGNERTTHFIWLLKDNNLFPIKTQHKDSITVFKNLVFDEPSASLFEIPPGFQKMSIPGMP